MDVLGIVEEITTDGKAVVKCETLPDMGCSVFDRKERKIGSVKRIFGPVDGPYASVAIEDKSILLGLKGKPLYFTKGIQHGKSKRRNGRN